MKGSYHVIDHHIVKNLCLGLMGFSIALLLPPLNLRPLNAALYLCFMHLILFCYNGFLNVVLMRCCLFGTWRCYTNNVVGLAQFLIKL